MKKKTKQRYVMQATREENGVLTFHLIPPLTDWHPQKYAEMIADLTGHVADYLSMSHENVAQLVQAELARRKELAEALDPLRAKKGGADANARAAN